MVANLLGSHDVHGDSCDYCQKGFGAVRLTILDGQRNWGVMYKLLQGFVVHISGGVRSGPLINKNRMNGL